MTRASEDAMLRETGRPETPAASGGGRVSDAPEAARRRDRSRWGVFGSSRSTASVDAREDAREGAIARSRDGARDACSSTDVVAREAACRFSGRREKRRGRGRPARDTRDDATRRPETPARRARGARNAAAAALRALSLAALTLLSLAPFADGATIDGTRSTLSSLPASVSVRRTTRVRISGYDAAGVKQTSGGDAASIVPVIFAQSCPACVPIVHDHGDVVATTVEDRADGDYDVLFVPMSTGTFEMRVAFHGANKTGYAPVFKVVADGAAPSHYDVIRPATFVAGDSAVFRIKSSADLDLDLDVAADAASNVWLRYDGVTIHGGVAAKLRYLGVNGVAPTGAAAAYEQLTVSSVERSTRERHFSFNKTNAGSYEVSVVLDDVLITSAPLTIAIGGGAPVNQLNGTRAGLTTRAYKSGTSPPAGAAQLPNPPPTSYDFIAGDTINFGVDLRDTHGNVATLSPAAALVVTYARRGGGGGIAATAAVTRTFEGVGAGFGHTAAVTLTTTGTYDVRITIGGVQLCVSQTAVSNTTGLVCVPPVVVAPATPIAASTSAVTGSGVSAVIAAGSSLKVNAVPKDTHGNALTEARSRAEVSYTARVTCATSRSPGVSNGQVVVNDRALAYVANSVDFSHSVGYTLQHAGTYTVVVTQTVGGVASVVGGGGGAAVTVVAGAIDHSRTTIKNSAGANAPWTVAAGVDGVVVLKTYDAIGNPVMVDRSASSRIVASFTGARGGVNATFRAAATYDPLTGSHSFAFNIARADAYAIEYFVDGVVVPGGGSALTIARGSTASMSASIAGGAGLRAATAGERATFFVTPRDAHGNALTSDDGVATTVTLTTSKNAAGEPGCQPGVVTAIASSAYAFAWDATTGRYEGSYAVEQAGTLKLSIERAGVPVRGGPFTIPVSPGVTHAGSSELSGVALGGVVVNTAGSVVVRAKDARGNHKTAGGDAICATLRAHSSTSAVAEASLSSASTTLTDNGDGTYLVTYTPTVVGTYSLYVTLGGAHVGTSPVAVQAAAAVGGVDYTKTYAEGDALATAIAGATNAFTINAVDANGVSLGAGGIAFDVTFTPATAGSTTLTIVRKTVGAAGADATDVTRDNADGSYRVTYTPVETGTYALDVKAPGAVAIKGTWPKTVTVYAGVASAATSRPSRTTLFPASAVAGSTITTKIEAFDAKGNARCYDARLFGGDAFTVSVVNAQDAAAGAALEKTAALTPNAAGGYYDVSMTPTIAGSYTVTFKLNGATILEGVKTFTVTHGPLNIANSIVEGVGVYGGVAGVASEAFVYARDAHGNAVTSGLTTADCRAKLNSDASFSAAVSLSASLGRFTVRWTATVPTTSAVATVELRDLGGNWAGAKNSPFGGLVYRAGASSVAAVTAGTGATAAISGVAATFVVTVKDASGNVVGVGGDAISSRVLVPRWGAGTRVVSGDVVDNGDGTYAVSYVAWETGTFSHEVKLGSSHVAGSPFSVVVTAAATSAAETFAEGTDSPAVAGVASTFVIRPMTTHKVTQSPAVTDNFVVTATPSSSASITSVVKRAEASGGGYVVTWASNVALRDAHGFVSPYSIAVKLGGSHVKGSPFSVKVNPGRAVASKSAAYVVTQVVTRRTTTDGQVCGATSVSGYQSCAVERSVKALGPHSMLTQAGPNVVFVAGVKQMLVVRLRDAYNNDATHESFSDAVEVTTTINGAAVVTATTTDLGEGVRQIVFTPTKAGSYALWIAVDGVNIGPNAAASLPIVVAPAAASLSHYQVWGPGVTTSAVVGAFHEIRVQPRDALGNAVVGDASLVTSGPKTLHAAIVVRVGEIYESTVRSVAVTGLTITHDAVAAANYTAGTYVIRFKPTTVGALVSTLSVVDSAPGGASAAVGASPYVAPIVKTNAYVTAKLSGSGASGAAMAVVDLPVVVVPVDADGNDADFVSAADASRFAFSVSPSSRAVVVKPLTFSSNGVLSASWKGTAAGDVTVSVTLDGAHVTGSPHVTTVAAHSSFWTVNPALSRMTGPALRGGYAGQSSSFAIELVTDAGADYPVSAEYDWDAAVVCPPGQPSKGLVKITRDGAPMTANVIDDCDGTYTVSISHARTGIVSYVGMLGPMPGNPTSDRPIGGVGPLSSVHAVRVYSGATSDVRVAWAADVADGVGRVNEAIVFTVTPLDSHGNEVDYKVFPKDDFAVVVTVDGGRYVESVPITRRTRAHASGVAGFETTYYVARFDPRDAGKHAFKCTFTGGSSSETVVDVRPGTPYVNTTTVWGDAVRVIKAGEASAIRVLLKDAKGNPAGDGAYVSAFDSALHPHHYLGGAVPIVESVLIPQGANASAGYVANTTFDVMDQTYVSTFNVTRPGNHTLRVLLYGFEVALGVDYEGTVVVAGSADAVNSTASGPGVGERGLPIAAGTATTFTITARDALGNPLTPVSGAAFSVVGRVATSANPSSTNASDWTANATHGLVSSVPVDNGDGTYTASFAPTRAGKYLLSVTHGTTHFAGSPFLVTVNAGASSAAHSTIECGALTPAACAVDGGGVAAGATEKFYVVVRDALGNVQTHADDKVYYAFTSTGGYVAEGVATAVANTPGWYEVAVAPRVVGAGALRVALDAGVVTNAAVAVVAGAADVSKFTLTCAGVPTTSAGATYAVVAAAFDANNNRVLTGGAAVKLFLDPTAPGGAFTEVLLADAADGTYVGSYALTTPGTHVASLQLAGAKKNVTFTVVAGDVAFGRAPAASAARDGVTGGTVGPFVAGKLSSIALQFTDKYGNVRYDANDVSSGTLTLKITNDDDGATTSVPVSGVTFNSQSHAVVGTRGTHNVTFTPTISGALSIHFAKNGASLIDPSTNQTYVAVVKPAAPSAANTLVYGAGATAAAMTKASVVNVVAADAHGNKILHDLPRVGDRPIAYSFRFAATSGGSAPNAAALAAIPQSAAYYGFGVTTLYYTPPTHASQYYLNVKVLADGVALPGAGRDVLVTPSRPVDAMKTIALDRTLRPINAAAAVRGAVANEAFKMLIEARDDNGAPLGASAASFVRVSVTPLVVAGSAAYATHRTELTSEGRVAVYVTATVAGEYSVYVEVNVAGSWQALGGNWAAFTDAGRGSVRLAVAADKTDATKVVATHLPANAVAGATSTLRLRSRDVGSNPAYAAGRGADYYRVTLKRSNGADEIVAAFATDHGDGDYDFSFTAHRAGTYATRVSLHGGVDVNVGNVVVVHAPSAHAASTSVSPPLATAATMGRAGELYRLTLTAMDALGNVHSAGDQTWTMTVTPPTGASAIDANVAANADGTYAATFTPRKVGTHVVSIAHSSGVVVLSSFKATISPGVIAKERVGATGTILHAAATANSVALVLRDYHNNVVTNATEATGGDVALSIPGVNGATVTPTIAAVSGGGFDASFIVPVVGSFNLNALVRTVAATRAPFVLDVARAPAPRLLAARVDVGKMKFDLTFATPADAAPRACAAVLTTATTTAVGTGATCAWADDKTLSVYFGPDATLAPGDHVVLMPGVIADASGSSHGATGVTRLLAPSSITPPVASISAPSAVGPCDNIAFDVSGSSGGGGRKLRYEFGIVANDATADVGVVVAALKAAAAAAAAASSDVVTLSSNVMTAGVSYNLTLQVTDYLGSAHKVHHGFVKRAYPTPIARVLGGEDRTIRRGHALSLEADVSLPDVSCASFPAVANVTYEWTLIGGPVLTTKDFPSNDVHVAYNKTLRTRALYVPPKVLAGGFKYTWRLRTSSGTNPGFYSDVTASATVTVGAIDANPITGVDRTAFIGAPLLLGVDPVDPDDARDTKGAPYSFTYAWSCALSSGGACGLPADKVPGTFYSPTASTVTLPAATLTSGKEYVFSVVVAKEPSVAGRSVTVAMRVKAATGPSVLVGAASRASNASIVVSGPSAGLVSPSERVTLRADVRDCSTGASACSVTWSCVAGGLNLGAAAELGFADALLTIKKDALTPGRTYTFRASGGGHAAGLHGDVVVTANAPPRGGTITATASPFSTAVTSRLWDASGGFGGLGRFVARADGWSDQSDHLPLSYTFYKKTGAGATLTRRPLSAPQASNVIDALLPAGTHDIEVVVADAYGAATTARVAVTVSNPNPPAGRRRLLSSPSGGAAAVEISTAGYNVTTARAFIADVLRPYVDRGAAAQVLQAATEYAAAFKASPGVAGVVNTTCVAADEIAPQHAVVAAAILDAIATTERTAEGATQTLCALSDLSSDPRTVTFNSSSSTANAIDAVTALTAEASRATDPVAAACAIALASNLLAVTRSTCLAASASAGFVASAAATITAAVDEVVAAAATTLLPGAPAFVADATHVSIAVRTAEPSANVGLPLAVALTSGKASVTFDFNSTKTGASFPNATTGAMVGSLKRLRNKYGATPAYASSGVGERLVSDYVVLGVSHPDFAAVADAMKTTTVTMSYDAAARNHANNSGRYPDVRFYDAGLGAALQNFVPNASSTWVEDPVSYDGWGSYSGWKDVGATTARSTETTASASATNAFAGVGPGAGSTFGVVMINANAPPRPSPPPSPPPPPPLAPPVPSPPAPPPAAPPKDMTQTYIALGAGLGSGFIFLYFLYSRYTANQRAKKAEDRRRHGPRQREREKRRKERKKLHMERRREWEEARREKMEAKRIFDQQRKRAQVMNWIRGQRPDRVSFEPHARGRDVDLERGEGGARNIMYPERPHRDDRKRDKKKEKKKNKVYPATRGGPRPAPPPPRQLTADSLDSAYGGQRRLRDQYRDPRARLDTPPDYERRY